MHTKTIEIEPMIEFDNTLGVDGKPMSPPVFDTTDLSTGYLKALDAADQEILKIIAQSFLDTLPSQCEMIHQYIQDRNPTLLINIFHALKGLFLTLYIQDIGAKLNELEQWSKTIEKSPFLEASYLDRLYLQINNEWNQLHGNIKVFQDVLLSKSSRI